MDDLNTLTHNEATVAVTLRWPESFWLAVSIKAKSQRMSLQQIGTVAVRQWMERNPADAEQDKTT
jgi:hypothetical protein